MGCNGEDWAVFWCSLLSPVLLGEIPEAQREACFQQLSREERRLPNGRWRRISARTFRRQWRRFKDGGVHGLHRRRRSDRGKARKKHAHLLARAVELKKSSLCARIESLIGSLSASSVAAYPEARSTTICDAREPLAGNWCLHTKSPLPVDAGPSRRAVGR